MSNILSHCACKRSADRKVIAAWINDTYAAMVGEQAEE
jgi:hypothetical protein